jgi:hypothetical protein
MLQLQRQAWHSFDTAEFGKIKKKAHDLRGRL